MQALLGYWVFGDLPDGFTCTGIALVIGTGLYLSATEGHLPPEDSFTEIGTPSTNTSSARAHPHDEQHELAVVLDGTVVSTARSESITHVS